MENENDKEATRNWKPGEVEMRSPEEGEKSEQEPRRFKVWGKADFTNVAGTDESDWTIVGYDDKDPNVVLLEFEPDLESGLPKRTKRVGGYRMNVSDLRIPKKELDENAQLQSHISALETYLKTFDNIESAGETYTPEEYLKFIVSRIYGKGTLTEITRNHDLRMRVKDIMRYNNLPIKERYSKK